MIPFFFRGGGGGNFNCFQLTYIYIYIYFFFLPRCIVPAVQLEIQHFDRRKLRRAHTEDKSGPFFTMVRNELENTSHVQQSGSGQMAKTQVATERVGWMIMRQRAG